MMLLEASTTWKPVMLAFAAGAVKLTRRVPVDVTVRPFTTVVAPLVGVCGTAKAVVSAEVAVALDAWFTDRTWKV